MGGGDILLGFRVYCTILRAERPVDRLMWMRRSVSLRVEEAIGINGCLVSALLLGNQPFVLFAVGRNPFILQILERSHSGKRPMQDPGRGQPCEGLWVKDPGTSGQCQ